MVVLFANSKNNYDFIILTSLRYGLARVGGPVVGYHPEIDFRSVTSLCFSGHGDVASIENYSADQIANHLTRSDKGVTSKLKNFIITSCYAGKRVNKQPGTSLVEILAKRLEGRGLKGLKIAGARGPSIKSNAIGELFYVVPDKLVGQAGPIQDAVKDKHNPQVLDGFTMGFSNSVKMMTAAYEAEAASESFYREFIGRLEDQKLLKNPEEAMRVVEVAN